MRPVDRKYFLEPLCSIFSTNNLPSNNDAIGSECIHASQIIPETTAKIKEIKQETRGHNMKVFCCPNREKQDHPYR